jgi:predicted DNA repair protein MutK
MAYSLLLLLDDIATVLDDVSVMTKVAVKKTAGVLGDDLALNAKQVTGVSPARELPVVWAVARGSAVNKAILVPAALAVSWLTPWAVTPLLMIGGAYLCYEGAEKILHRFLPGAKHSPHHTHPDSTTAQQLDPATIERDKIAGAIRTDFILSAEIIVITLGVVAGQPLSTQVAVLVAISVAMTIGVYGLVAGIVKLDDVGAFLAGQRSPLSAGLGRGLLAAAPWLMRGLSVAGTAAMFLVGGGIIAHGIPPLHDAVHDLATAVGGHLEGTSAWLTLFSMAADAVTGLVVGLSLVVVGTLGARVWPRHHSASSDSATRPAK